MMSKGFQNGISQFEKKIRPSSSNSFHTFDNMKKVCKKFFFYVDTIALAAYAEQLLPRGKAAVCCILLRGIEWTHLNDSHDSLGNLQSMNVSCGEAAVCCILLHGIMWKHLNDSHDSLDNLESMSVSSANMTNLAFFWHISTIGTQERVSP